MGGSNHYSISTRVIPIGAVASVLYIEVVLWWEDPLYIGGSTVLPRTCSIVVCIMFLLLRTEDLWAHLAGASGKPVAEVMSAWTKRLGYPVLSVEGKQVGTCVYDTIIGNLIKALGQCV